MRVHATFLRLGIAVLALGLTLVPSAGAPAGCNGTDLIGAMPAKERAAIEARADSAPFAHGNLWRATKGDQEITIAGTFHLNDPRNAATLATLRPALTAARLLLVEAGPDEIASLKAELRSDPSLIVAPAGQSLFAELPHDRWVALADAMEKRGIPRVMVVRLRPWYVMAILQSSTCAPPGAAAGGLDIALMNAAQAHGVPIRALEPADTVFRIFNGMSRADQLGLLTTALAGASDEQDGLVTLANAYFRGETRLMWEFAAWETAHLPGIAPQEAARQQALMERTLIADRNRAWVPVIEKAAADGPVLAAFGALHLSGKTGVLELLAEDGWVVEPYRH